MPPEADNRFENQLHFWLIFIFSFPKYYFKILLIIF